MILKGKCKEDFEKWLKENYNQILHGSNIDTTYFYDMILLGNIKNIESIKNALIIEFFDSVGIYIEPLKENSFGFILHTGNYKKPILSITGFNSRPKAQTEAIKKANEIYNKKILKHNENNC